MQTFLEQDRILFGSGFRVKSNFRGLKGGTTLACLTIDLFKLATMDFREGDWMCPVCGDVNFGARQLCRKCNTIRPDLIATLTTTRYDIEENQTNPASGGGGVSGGESEGHIMTEEETLQAQLQAMQQIQAFKAIQQQIQAIQALTQAAHTGTLYSGGMAMPPVAKQVMPCERNTLSVCGC